MESHEVLQIGTETEDVLDVQARLLFLGYYTGHVHGQFDSATEAAVVHYQQVTGQSATGTLDAGGFAQLHEYADAHHYGVDHSASAEHGHDQHRQHGHDQHGHDQHGHDQHGHDQQTAERAWTAEELQAWQEQQQQAQPASTVEEINFDEGSTLSSDRHAYENWVPQTLTNVSNRALTLAIDNDTALMNACESFRTGYALERIHEFQNRVTGEDIAKQIVRSALDITGMRLCGTLAAGIGKELISQVSAGLARKASNTAKSAFSNEGTVQALREAVDAAIIHVRMEQAVLHDILRTELPKVLAPLYTAGANGDPLPPADAEWVGRCYGGADTQLDAVIEEVFGIRGPAQIAEMQIAVYNKLAEGLAELIARKDQPTHIFPDRRTERERLEQDGDPVQRIEDQAHAATAQFAEQIGHPLAPQ